MKKTPKKRALKIRGLDVSEILAERERKFDSDYSELVAKKELVYRLKTIASKKACTIGEFARILKKLKYPLVTRNLEEYLKKTPRSRLRYFIKYGVILKIDPYSFYHDRYTVREHWYHAKNFLFSYYYYSSKKFVDVYKLKTSELPLYMANEFESEGNKQDFHRRLVESNEINIE